MYHRPCREESGRGEPLGRPERVGMYQSVGEDRRYLGAGGVGRGPEQHGRVLTS